MGHRLQQSPEPAASEALASGHEGRQHCSPRHGASAEESWLTRGQWASCLSLPAPCSLRSLESSPGAAARTSPARAELLPTPTLPLYLDLQRHVQVRLVGVRNGLTLHTLHCKRASDEHTPAQHPRLPPPQHSAGSCGIPPRGSGTRALGCPAWQGGQVHYGTGQRALLGSWQHGLLRWWQRAGDPQPTAFSITTTRITTHGYRKTDQLQLRIIYTRAAIFPKYFHCEALGERAARRVTGPGPGSQHSPRDCREPPKIW